MTPQQLIDNRLRYELRDTDETQYTDPELLAYINKAAGLLHEVLIDEDSELVRSGSGSFVTVDGTETYNLTANGMADLLAPYRVYITGYEPMDLKSEAERYAYLDDTAPVTGQPDRYYLSGDVIGLLPIPDDVYTVNVAYYPPYTDVALADAMPFRGIFDRVIGEAAILTARAREEMGVGLQAQLMEMFHDAASAVMRRRRVAPIGIHPRQP